MNILDLAVLKKLGGGGGGTGSADIDVTAEVGQTIIVKAVDANGKPTEWENADYQPRIAWSEEGVGDIVPTTTYTPVYNADLGCTQYPLSPFKLEAGKTYTVIFDGVEYTCEAMQFVFPLSEGGANKAYYVAKGVGIGNTIFIGGANTGQPFSISEVTLTVVYTDSNGKIKDEIDTYTDWLVFGMDTNQHTLKVTGEKTIYNKIPATYVKNDLAVVFTVGLNDTMYMITPWEEIDEAVEANANIYGVINNISPSYDKYGQPNGTKVESRRLVCTYAKIFTETMERRLEFIYNTLALGSVLCERDINGITTVTAYAG